MPTSYLYQLNTIVELIVFANPASILDVGIGFGKYGFLSREYLELREDEGSGKRRIEGVEVFKGYITPVQELIYDKIHIGDAAQVVPSLKKSFDLILLIDVVEHFRLAEGMQLLTACRCKARNVIVSTPKRFHPQKAAFGNPFEEHRSWWARKHFEGLPNRWIVPHELSWICFAGDDMQRVRREARHQSRVLWRSAMAERMKRPLRAVRSLFIGGNDINQ